MTHSEPETLALLAMGEDNLPAEDVEHVENCADCAAEVRSLRRVTDLVRSGRPDDAFSAPDVAVWDRISDELGVSARLTPGHPMDRERGDNPAIAGGPDSPIAIGAVNQDAGVDSAVSVRRHRPRGRPQRGRGAERRSSRGRRISVVVALVIAVALAGVTTVTLMSQTSSESVLASAQLEPLPDGGAAHGKAVVEQSSAGVRDVFVQLDDAPEVSGYQEVWLLSPKLDRLVSLGALSGTTGRFTIPAGVDLADFPVVDVSVEKVDGDPGHSGDSIARGTLTA